MKMKILLITLVVSVIIPCYIFLSDGLTYLIASLMALVVLGIIRFNKPGVMKLTRWAKANPRKAKWLISGLQIAIIGLGVVSGKNLRELGYLFSDTTAYIFMAMMVIGFLSVPFWQKRNTIALPKNVDKQRFAYLGISISFLILTTQIGNRIEDIFPNSPITHAIQIIDQSIFSDNMVTYLGYNQESPGQIKQIQSKQASTDGFPFFAVFAVVPSKGLKTIDQTVLPDNNSPGTTLKKAPSSIKEIRKATKEMRKQYRKSGAVISSGAATILTIFLVLLVCVGACLFLGGFAAVLSGSLIGFVGIIAGPLILFAAVKGIKNLSKKNRAPSPAT